MIEARSKDMYKGLIIDVYCWICDKEVDKWVGVWPQHDEEMFICLECSKSIGEHARFLKDKK